MSQLLSSELDPTAEEVAQGCPRSLRDRLWPSRSGVILIGVAAASWPLQIIAANPVGIIHPERFALVIGVLWGLGLGAAILARAAGASPAVGTIIGVVFVLGLQRGDVFVANFGTAFGKKSFAAPTDEHRASFLADLKTSVEVAKRVNATWMTVVPGDLEPRLERERQDANAIELLRRGAEVFEPHGLVMVLEPLNPWRDHPGMLLWKSSQAYLWCKAVASPAETGASLAELGYMREYIEGLPYQSEVMNIDLADWQQWPAQRQFEFINQLDEKAAYYKALHDNVDLWVSLDGESIDGDSVYPLLLEALP